MKLITYAGSEYLTGDEIALALMEYSKGLADQNMAETVQIPIRNADGSLGAAMFLVGPSSQIVARDVEGGDELLDPGAVELLRRLTTALHPVAGEETARHPMEWSEDDL